MQQYRLSKLKYSLFGIVSLLVSIGIQAKPTTLLFCQSSTGGNHVYQIVLNDDRTLYASWYDIEDKDKFNSLAQAKKANDDGRSPTGGSVDFIEAVKNQNGKEANSRMITYFSGKSLDFNKPVNGSFEHFLWSLASVTVNEENPLGEMTSLNGLKGMKDPLMGQSWIYTQDIYDKTDTNTKKKIIKKLNCFSSSHWVEQNKDFIDKLNVPEKSVFPLNIGFDRNTKNNYCTFRLSYNGTIGDLRSVQWNTNKNATGSMLEVIADSIVVPTNTVVGDPTSSDDYSFSYAESDEKKMGRDKQALYSIRINVNKNSATVGYEKSGGNSVSNTKITDVDCVVKSLKKNNDDSKG